LVGAGVAVGVPVGAGIRVTVGVSIIGGFAVSVRTGVEAGDRAMTPTGLGGGVSAAKRSACCIARPARHKTTATPKAREAISRTSGQRFFPSIMVQYSTPQANMANRIATDAMSSDMYLLSDMGPPISASQYITLLRGFQRFSERIIDINPGR